MWIIECSPRISSFICKSSIKIQINWIEWMLMPNFIWTFEELQSSSFCSSCSRVCCCRMEAMRAWSQCGSIFPVVIIKFNTIYKEIFCSWCNNTMWFGPFKLVLSITWFSNNKSIFDLSHFITILSCQGKFNSCKYIISYLKVNKSYISDSFSYSTISSIFPTC